MYRKFMIKNSSDRKKLIRSNMDFCMAEVKSGVNEYA